MKITKALQEDVIFIDTRSQKEFAIDHLPDAINLPILDDEERAVVGTIYKQESQEEAIQKGVEFFSKKLPHFSKEMSKYKDKKIVIYCWRGGMRSKTVVSLFSSLGYNVHQLEGGYKSYREYVRDNLHNYKIKPKFIVLSGLTCTGKTQLLYKFNNSLDLEGLAQHRGSLYGAIGLKPRSQKMFENLLLQRLDELNNEKFVFVEGESRRIGDLMIPEPVWKAMKAGIQVKITRSIENRAKEAVVEYDVEKNVEEIKKVTQTLWKVISKNNKEEVVKLLDEKKYAEAVKILLEFYYDLLYENTLKNIKFDYEVCNDDLEKAVISLTNLQKESKSYDPQ